MLLTMLLSGFLSQDAQAAPKTYGVGISVRKHLFPFGYPLSLPDYTPEGGEKTSTPLEDPSSDFGIGGKGVLYMNSKWRGSIHPMYTILTGADGSNTTLNVSFEVDRILQTSNGIQIYVGGGLGTGSVTFDQGSDGKLTASQLFARGQAGGLYKDGKRAYELAFFATFGYTGDEKFELGDQSYTNGGWAFLGEESSSESLEGAMYFPVIGIEGTIYFGRFKKKRRKKKKKK